MLASEFCVGFWLLDFGHRSFPLTFLCFRAVASGFTGGLKILGLGVPGF